MTARLPHVDPLSDRLSGQLLEKSGLADPGVASQQETLPATLSNSIEPTAEGGEKGLSSQHGDGSQPREGGLGTHRPFGGILQHRDPMLYLSRQARWALCEGTAWQCHGPK